MKPIFRWTVYLSNNLSLQLLIESVCQTPKSLGENKFDWIVQFNGNKEGLEIVKDTVMLSSAKIKVIHQAETDCPIQAKPLLSKWKITPPRLNLDVQEIICDNDLIFTKHFPKIDNFLETNKPLILKDIIRFYGNLDYLHPPNNNYNSGLLTLPANFDFEKEIKTEWERLGKPNLGYAEEQAFLTKIIMKLNPTPIETNEIVELNKDSNNYQITGNEFGFHFVESNRNNNHSEAKRFLEKSNKLLIPFA